MLSISPAALGLLSLASNATSAASEVEFATPVLVGSSTHASPGVGGSFYW